MLTQAQIAKAWGAGCFKGTKLTFTLYGGGRVTVRPAIGDAVLALDACLRQFSYPAEPADTGGYNCRPKTGSTETSNHGRAIAIDIDWLKNPYGHHMVTNMPPPMVEDICAVRTNNGKQVWNWGGNWSGNKDAMHYEIVCTPADLATGINPRTVPSPAAKPTPPPPPPLDLAAVRRAFARALQPQCLALPVPMDNRTTVGPDIATLQGCLNTVLSTAGIPVTSVYDGPTAFCVLAFEKLMNAFTGDPAHPAITDAFPGQFSNQIRWLLAESLEKIADGQA